MKKPCEDNHNSVFAVEFLNLVTEMYLQNKIVREMCIDSGIKMFVKHKMLNGMSLLAL